MNERRRDDDPSDAEQELFDLPKTSYSFIGLTTEEHVGRKRTCVDRRDTRPDLPMALRRGAAR